MSKQPDYALFQLEHKKDEFLVRKLLDENTVGISIHKDYEGWSPSVSVEYFINRAECLNMILDLIQYFKITQEELGF